MKGKNFSCNNLGQRRKSDFYETPYSLTERLLEQEHFTPPILEPAQGAGAITRVLQKKGIDVVAYDSEVDFLQEQRKFPSIITNPPFSLSLEFILRAKQVAGDKFAFLLPLSYLHGKTRYDEVYTDALFPLARVYVLTRYPMLGADPLREDGKYRTGMMVYAWYVWDKKYKESSPHICWIDNNDDVLRNCLK